MVYTSTTRTGRSIHRTSSDSYNGPSIISRYRSKSLDDGFRSRYGGGSTGYASKYGNNSYDRERYTGVSGSKSYGSSYGTNNRYTTSGYSASKNRSYRESSAPSAKVESNKYSCGSSSDGNRNSKTTKYKIVGRITPSPERVVDESRREEKFVKYSSGDRKDLTLPNVGRDRSRATSYVLPRDYQTRRGRDDSRDSRHKALICGVDGRVGRSKGVNEGRRSTSPAMEVCGTRYTSQSPSGRPYSYGGSARYGSDSRRGSGYGGGGYSSYVGDGDGYGGGGYIRGGGIGSLRPILRRPRSNDRLTRDYRMRRSRSLNDLYVRSPSPRRTRSPRTRSPAFCPGKPTGGNGLSCGRDRDGRDGASTPDGPFPVCSRFPNCSVCIMDIPQNQLNRDDILYNLQNELREESENIALIEKKDKEIHLKAESISHITQMLQKTRKELEIKISECNRRESEVKHLKQELKTVLTEKKTIESSHSEQQITIAKLESVETKLQQLTVRYDEVVQHNRELLERVKTLEISEKEFIDLERNVIDLQVQLRDMEDIELHRDELYQKLQYVKKQRDEFLEKGKLVEEERNEFVRSNKTLEQYLAEWKRKTVEFKKTNQALKDRIISLERDKKELEERIIHLQEERVVIQTSLNKVELERDDYIRELKEVSIERNSLETRLGDLEDMLGDYDQLEEGFHSLRLKVAELTRQRDDAEMLIPSYKQKLSMLKKALHDKEDTVMQLSHDLKTLKVAVENCTYEDLTRLKSFNYLSSDSSLPRRPSFSNKEPLKKFFTAEKEAIYDHKKYRPSDYDLTTDSDSIDPLFIRPSQTYESYSDDSIQKRAPKQRRHKSRRCVALFDYDPYRSSTSDHPERELRLREGDYITVYGEMDIDGYLEAEVDGIRGLVPSIYVEEISEDGSMDYRRPGNQYHSDYSDELVRKFRVMYDYDPFTMATTDTVDRQLSLRKGDVVTVYGNMDEDGYYYAQRNGKRGLIPSNFVEEYHSSGSGSHHQHTHHTQQQQNQKQQSANYQGTIGQSANYQGTIEIEEDAGPPYAPRDLKVVRVVTRNAVLLGWGLPPMDEYGRSNGCRVTGYRLWVNGKRKQDCNSPSMTKALVDDVDLHGRVEFSIQTVGENGFCSEKCHFAITGALSALSKDNDFELDGNHNTYVALYDYDPFKSSPNPNPSLELSFQEGDLIRVYDKSRNDGFYGAEINGKRGLVPSNFIERIGGSTSGSYHHHQHHSSTTAHHDSDSNSRRVQFK